MQTGGLMERIAYIGIDVHKDTNTACLFARKEHEVLLQDIGTMPAGCEYMAKAIRKALKSYGLMDWDVLCGYEAGPTGYGLCKGLQKAGFKCEVMAPSTIRKASGERTKTDRRDARMLALALSTDSYHAVHILDDKDIATREFTRTRNARKGDLKRAKQHLQSFLLRMGRTYPEGGSHWTDRHWRWLGSLSFDDEYLDYSFRSYMQDIKDLEHKISMMDDMIEDIASKDGRYRDRVAKLKCFTGVETHTALSIVCEIGDFERFPDAKSFSSYIGLVPGQDSSGKRQRYTEMTKTGNARVRTLLVEAAKGIKRSSPFNKSKRLVQRQSGQDPDVIAYADRCRRRLKLRMKRLEESSGKNANVATAAAARELACFVWGMMTGNIA